MRWQKSTEGDIAK